MPSKADYLIIKINHSHAGLFAYVNFAINQIIYAEKNNLIPVVYFGQQSGDGLNVYYIYLLRYSLASGLFSLTLSLGIITLLGL